MLRGDRRGRRGGADADEVDTAGLPTTLRGRRVVLRPLRASDWAAWNEVRVRNGTWLTKWEPAVPAGRADPSVERHAYLARCAGSDREWQSGMGFGFGVFVTNIDEQQLVGEVRLGHVHRGSQQSAYLGYWIDQAVAGQSLMPEAVAVALWFSFEHAGLHRVQISIIPRNTASRRVVEKLGLREEGTALRYIEINGVWEDHLRFAITAEEWRQRRDELLAAWC